MKLLSNGYYHCNCECYSSDSTLVALLLWREPLSRRRKFRFLVPKDVKLLLLLYSCQFLYSLNSFHCFKAIIFFYNAFTIYR